MFKIVILDKDNLSYLQVLNYDFIYKGGKSYLNLPGPM